MIPFPLIPGETPLEDLSGLRAKGVATKPQLNQLEAENIRKAILKYLAAKPSKRSARFDLAWVRRLHADMFGDVWKWAGQFRTGETNIGARPFEIEVQLQELLDDLNAWKSSDMPLDEQGARLHHRAVLIHPFPNGNGRWARMLANVWLRLHGASPIEWPETVIGTASTIRDEYIRAVRAADGGDISALLAMHRQYIQKGP